MNKKHDNENEKLFSKGKKQKKKGGGQIAWGELTKESQEKKSSN